MSFWIFFIQQQLQVSLRRAHSHSTYLLVDAYSHYSCIYGIHNESVSFTIDALTRYQAEHGHVGNYGYLNIDRIRWEPVCLPGIEGSLLASKCCANACCSQKAVSKSSCRALMANHQRHGPQSACPCKTTWYIYVSCLTLLLQHLQCFAGREPLCQRTYEHPLRTLSRYQAKNQSLQCVWLPYYHKKMDCYSKQYRKTDTVRDKRNSCGVQFLPKGVFILQPSIQATLHLG